MIFAGSKIRIKDNSGAKWINCIKPLNSSPRKGLKALGICVVSVRSIKNNKNKIFKGKIFKSVCIRQAKNFTRKNGFSVRFKQNTLTLLNEKNNPIASRIKGPVYKEFRSRYFSKVTILSNFSV